MPTKVSHPDSFPRGRQPGYVGKRFGDLRVRVKLLVLHNLFFLVLAAAVYVTVIPILEQRVAGAKARELSLINQIFVSDSPLPKIPGLENYPLQEGALETLEISPEIREWIDFHPGRVYGDPNTSDFLYRRIPGTSIYRKVLMPHAYYNEALSVVRWALFGVLGVIYILAVLVLEFAIMPLYVYRPLRAMLEADRATLAGDKDNEMVDAALIPGDEIGEIMLSRNNTVAQLRKHEADLESALSHLENARRTLVEQERLASLGLLSAGVAHELNTPLSVLQGSIDKLVETVTQPQAQERLRRMQRVASRLRTISEGLLDFARMRKPTMSNVAIRPLVDEAWELVGIDEKSQRVRFTNSVPERFYVYGNADRLIQVFVNLLRNALQAVPEQEGCIRVSAETYQEEGSRWWLTAVEDNGPGISEAVLPDVFEAFISTKLDSKGTGLGLTVSEGIVQSHGGRIAACNNPGGGARLEIRLPEAPVQTETKEQVTTHVH